MSVPRKPQPPQKVGPFVTTCGQPIVRVSEALWDRSAESKLQRLFDRRRENAAAFSRPRRTSAPVTAAPASA
jgi:hypothetical protein